MLQSVAVCCNVSQYHVDVSMISFVFRQCVVVYCIVMQCVAACCSVLQCHGDAYMISLLLAVHCSVLQHNAVGLGVFWCAAVWRCVAVLQCVALPL